MALTSIAQKASALFIKYKYVILILILGFILMQIPSREKNIQLPSEESENSAAVPMYLQLAQILSTIDGVGDVQVLLTVAEGERTIFQTDNNVSNSDTQSTTKIDTVTVTDASRNQVGLIQQVIPPTFQGAIVVCQGADSPTVKLAIVEAVSKVTGLGADRISVLKMK